MSNGRGIYLVSSKGCTVSKNTITDNGYYGIILGSCTGNTISGNTASNNARGIHVGSSDDNTLSDNTVTSNNAYGINVTSGSAPLSVIFTDKSTGTPTTWNWNFGDGTSSSTQHPAHTYSTAGNYIVVSNA